MAKMKTKEMKVIEGTKIDILFLEGISLIVLCNNIVLSGYVEKRRYMEKGER
jgi:hypothetical protein